MRGFRRRRRLRAWLAGAGCVVAAVAAAAACLAVVDGGGEVVAVEAWVDEVDGEIVVACAVDAAVVVAFEHGRSQDVSPVAAVSALGLLFCVPAWVAVASVFRASTAGGELSAAWLWADRPDRAHLLRVGCV